MSTQDSGNGPMPSHSEATRPRHWAVQPIDADSRNVPAATTDLADDPAAHPGVAGGFDALGAEDRRALLEAARLALARAAIGAEPPRLRATSARLLEPQACFVTLTKRGELRGCIGHVYPRVPLIQAVGENTRWAALRDPRFRPVQPREVSEIRIEISVLSELRVLGFSSPADLLEQVRAQEHGVVLEVAGRSATFLPQVWTQLPDKVDFLEHLCQKSGCDPSAWRSPDAVISVFNAEPFEEPEA